MQLPFIPATNTNNTTTNHSFSSSSCPSVLQSKKKRKRCGECVGCQRKDNCGECAPCRNDKSHQICKQRRCEKLTEKKVSNQQPVAIHRLPFPSPPLSVSVCQYAHGPFSPSSVDSQAHSHGQSQAYAHRATHSFRKKKEGYSMKIATTVPCTVVKFNYD